MATAKERRKLSLNDLMGQLGDAHPGSAVRPGLEAEFDRRKFIWQRRAVWIAIVGICVAIIGIIVAASFHLQ
jgi:hypothetical protein